MSIQAFGILPKVIEADELLNAQPDSREIFREAHPEVCFYLLNNRRPLAYSKKKPEGREQRVSLLRSWYESEVDAVVAQRPQMRCEADDIIDSLAGLWTAERIQRGEAITLPAIPPVDAKGIRMEMVA